MADAERRWEKRRGPDHRGEDRRTGDRRTGPAAEAAAEAAADEPAKVPEEEGRPAEQRAEEHAPPIGRRHPPGAEQEEQQKRPRPTARRNGTVRGQRRRRAVRQERQRRKEHVLTQARASVVSSITDAVVAKDGEPFFICKPDGQVPVEEGHGYGFYHHDCRFLSGYEILLGDRRPDGLAAAETTVTGLVIELTNPDLVEDGEELPKEQLGLMLTRRVDGNGPALQDDIAIQNFGREPAELPVDLRFRAGFEDVFLIRGLLDVQPGTCHEPEWKDGRLEFRYEGADHVNRFVRIAFDPPPEERRPDGARLRVRVGGRETASVKIRIELEERATDGAAPIERRDSPHSRPRLNDEARRGGEGRASETGWVGGRGWASAIATPSLALRTALGRSLDDLVQLRGELDGLRYYEAGIPWFATLFGRDALITALESMAFDPEIAAETLRLLARRQGRQVDDWRDEQPGKILHELRIGELARMNEIPHTPYYGSIDATPLFLVVLAEHAAWTGSLDLFNELRVAVDGALGWLDEYGDTDGDGFVDYRSSTSRGLVNQGWKDSGDGIVNAAGDLAEPPVALAEVQGYVWRAWTEIATLLERAGDPGRAEELRSKAAGLRDRFERTFWSEELGCYLLAIGNGKPCDVVASNAGQVLWTGIASDAHARRVGGRLMRSDMYSGWGIRTLSSDAAAYHPIGYHLGTVWPHDNALIAAGFRRYGLDDAAERLFMSLLQAAEDFPDDRLPECFAGFARQQFGAPVRYPVACHPQAWAAGAIPYLLVSMLGLVPHGFENHLEVCRSCLPPGIDDIEVRGLPVGAGTAHLRFTRGADGTTNLEILETTHGLRVTTSERVSL